MEITAESLGDFEGLVLSTTRMYARQVGREEEDLAQELRVRVWKAIEKFDAGRSTWMDRGYEKALRGYVFLAITNKIRDYKRDAARERDRLAREGLAFIHIESFSRHDSATNQSTQEAFDAKYHFISQEDVYFDVERAPFECPPGLTHAEHAVAALLALGYDVDECATELGCGQLLIKEIIAELQVKLAAFG